MHFGRYLRKAPRQAETVLSLSILFLSIPVQSSMVPLRIWGAQHQGLARVAER